jgi:hypothetical protein
MEHSDQMGPVSRTYRKQRRSGRMVDQYVASAHLQATPVGNKLVVFRVVFTYLFLDVT